MAAQTRLTLTATPGRPYAAFVAKAEGVSLAFLDPTITSTTVARVMTSNTALRTMPSTTVARTIEAK